MRERTTWSRQTIASQLRKVAEDPRAMNQDHLQQQPAADAYVIGGPSEFAEDSAEPELSVRLGRGERSAHVWFSDLGYEYVRINTEYTT